jgi:hypothetical protein
VTTHIFNFRSKSPKHRLDVFKTYHGPTYQAFGALKAEQQMQPEGDLQELLGRLNRGGRDTLIVPSEYMQVVVTKP